MNKKRIVITIGDPAGCGAQITLKAISAIKRKNIEFFVVGDKVVVERLDACRRMDKRIKFVDLQTPSAKGVIPGNLSKSSGRMSLSYIDRALSLAKEKNIKHLVTAPVSKEAIQEVNRKFCGHTEYLAEHFKSNNFAMLMVAKKLKVVLATRHIPLAEVSFSLKKDSLIKLISLINFSLRHQFNIKNPNIVFAAVNPHAGVNTFLGREEKVITKAIKESQIPVSGPYPSDTLFVKEVVNKYDCIICTYHDQAMIPFKLLSFREGVNVTLGLPIIRTSPAHGVAIEAIRQKKKLFYSSMLNAIDLALRLQP